MGGLPPFLAILVGNAPPIIDPLGQSLNKREDGLPVPRFSWRSLCFDRHLQNAGPGVGNRRREAIDSRHRRRRLHRISARAWPSRERAKGERPKYPAGTGWYRAKAAPGGRGGRIRRLRG